MAEFINSAKAVGDFGDDWGFTGTTKVASVQPGSNNYIYLDSHNTILQVRFHLASGMPTAVFSGNFTLTTTPPEYYIALGVGWGLDMYNEAQTAVAADSGAPQSFKFHHQGEPLDPYPSITTSIGVKFKAWYEDLGGGVDR